MRHTAAWMIWFLVASQAGCRPSPADGPQGADASGDDSVDTDVTATSKTIGAQGGTLRVEGAELVIPVGALDREVEITLARLAVHPHPQDQHSAAFDFGPDGQVFLLPAHLTLATDGTSSTAIQWSSDGVDFSPLPTVVAGHEAKADIEHFSVGYAGAPAADDTDVDSTDTTPGDTDTFAGPVDTDTITADTDVVVADTDLGLDTDNPPGNHAPTTPGVFLIPSPGPVTPVEQHLICRLDVPSTDAEGDALTYRIGWTRNHIGVSSLATGTTWRPGDTVPSTTLSPGDAWACYAVANDGSVDSAPGMSASVTIDDFRRYTTMVAERGTTCVIDQHRTPWCWGDNSYLSATIPTGLQWSKVALSERYVCGLALTGEAQCFGTSTSTANLGAVPAGPFVDVLAFDRSAVGLRANGTITAWGDHGYITGAPTLPITQLAGDGSVVCGIVSDRSIQCWGDATADAVVHAPTTGEYSQLSISPSSGCAIRTDGTLMCWASPTTSIDWTPPAGNYVQLSATSGHACAIDAFGVMACWGDNSDGELDVPSGVRFQSVDVAQEDVSCGLTLDSDVRCWGDMEIGYFQPPAASSDLRSSRFDVCNRDDAGAWSCVGSYGVSPAADAADV